MWSQKEAKTLRNQIRLGKVVAIDQSGYSGRRHYVNLSSWCASRGYPQPWNHTATRLPLKTSILCDRHEYKRKNAPLSLAFGHIRCQHYFPEREDWCNGATRRKPQCLALARSRLALARSARGGTGISVASCHFLIR